MASVNKVILIGNLGKDPEMRYMPNGEAVANFSIACTENWKDKSGEKQEKTEWVNIVVYKKLAEIVGQYLKKGSSCYIEGKLQTRKWEKDGITRYSTEVIADQMRMLSPRDAGASTDNAPPARNAAPSTDKPDGQKASGFDDFEDDIPF